VKALDTNVLIRYLVADDAVQARKAAAYIEGAEEEGERILISHIVLCETVWVLDSAYGYDKSEITGAIEKLLRSATFQFEAKDVLSGAFEEYRSANVDFADCLIGRVNASMGCEPTVTFDSALRKLATFRVL
jgi:predicted nucleic-acid-binding protein